MPGRYPDPGQPLTEYMEMVDQLEPDHFWPFQGNMLASHGTVDIVPQYSGYENYWIEGPKVGGAGYGNSWVWLRASDLAAMNANVNTTAYSYGAWFQHPIYPGNNYYDAKRTMMGNWATNGTMIHVGDNSTGLNDDWSIYHNNASVQVDPPAYYERGDWIHIMVVWDGVTQTTYMDGEVATTIARTDALGAAAVFNIGTYNQRSDDRSSISIAYAGWWVNRALSQAEVKSLATGPAQMIPERSKLVLTPGLSPSQLSPAHRLHPTGIAIQPIKRGYVGDTSVATMSEFAERITVGAPINPQGNLEISQGVGRLSLSGHPCGNYAYSWKQGDLSVGSEDVSSLFVSGLEDSLAQFIIVEGDMTVEEGAVLKPSERRLFTCIYVVGDLTVNGEISMSQRGANHNADTGSNIAPFDIRISKVKGEDIVIPAFGGAGGVVTNNAGGIAGGSPAVGTGGGGSGRRYYSSPSTYGVGFGSDGTCFSGGSGGGGVGNLYTHPVDPQMHAGAWGGRGGTNQTSNVYQGAGAGNPPGGAAGAGNGGTLVIICGGTYSGTGSITSAGSDGTAGTYGGGGGSGGGCVTIICGANADGPTPTALGGLGGTGSYAGGDGGQGSTLIIEKSVGAEMPATTTLTIADYPNMNEMGGAVGYFNSWDSSTVFTDLTDVPDDFGYATKVECRTVSALSGPWVDDFYEFEIRVENADGTMVLAGESSATGLNTGYYENQGRIISDSLSYRTVAFKYVNSFASKEDWDGARLRIYPNRDIVGTADSPDMILDYIGIIVTYARET